MLHLLQFGRLVELFAADATLKTTTSQLLKTGGLISHGRKLENSERTLGGLEDENARANSVR